MMGQSQCHTNSTTIWEYHDISYTIGSERTFVISTDNTRKTKPFGLISQEFDIETFVREHADSFDHNMLVIWARIVDMKIDRRGRVYPIVKPITAFERQTLERCGALDILEGE